MNAADPPPALPLPADTRKLDALFANSFELLALFTADNHYLYLSPNVGQILGYSRDELVGRDASADVHPDDAVTVFGPRMQVLQDPGATAVGRFRLRRKDGSYQWVEAVLTNRLEDPDFRAMVVNARPIDEIEEVDEADVDIRLGKDAARLLRAQRDLNVSLGRTHTPREAAEVTVRVCRRLPGLDVAGIYAFEEGTGDLVLLHAQGGSDDFMQTNSRYPKSDQRLAWLASAPSFHGLPLPVPSPGPRHDKLVAEGLTTLSVVPLVHRGQVLGCLNVASRTHSSFGHEVRSALEGIGSAMAEALAGFEVERAARRSAERLTELFRTMAQGVVYQDASGQVTDVNPAMCAMLGLTREEILQRGAQVETVREDGSPLPPDERPPAVALATGQPQRGVVMGVVTGTGEKRWLVEDAFPSFAEGRVSGVHTVVTDVTERRRNAEALRVKVAEYKALVDASHDGYVVATPDARLTAVNDVFCAMVQRPRDELLGLAAAELVTEDDLPKLASALAAAQSTGFARTEISLRRPDEGAIPTEVSAWRAPMSENLVAFVRDLSERHEAAARIAEHERRYQAIVRGALDLFVVADAAGNILEVNDAGCALLGHARAALLKMKLAELDPVFASHTLQATTTRVDRWHRFEAPLKAPNGAVLEMEISAWALGEQGPVLAFGRDLTQQRTAQRDLRRSQEALLHAQKMEAIGRLAGGIAHDFNNLLTVINTTAELAMLSMNEGDPLRHDLDDIANAGRRAAGLTRQLLTFSRRQVIDPRVVDLNGVVTDLERMLRRLIGEDIELCVQKTDGAPLVFADRGQLEQVIVNLVVNSRDAMPTGGRVTISTTVRDVASSELPPDVNPGRFVVLSVIDTGVGMDELTQTHLFEPFFTTKGKAGTGLGLSTVYGIVKQGGGHVRVASSPGRGARVDVMLPLSSPRSTPPNEPRRARGDQGAGETILLVEDEPSVRGLVKNVLTTSGYNVLAAADGDEALQICATYTNEIHVLFTDVVMPRMNGRDLADRLKALRPSLRVIYCSGYPDEVLTREGMLAPEIHFVPKPLEINRVRAELRKVLDAGP